MLTVLRRMEEDYLVALVAVTGDAVRAPPFDSAELLVRDMLGQEEEQPEAGGGCTAHVSSFPEKKASCALQPAIFAGDRAAGAHRPASFGAQPPSAYASRG